MARNYVAQEVLAAQLKKFVSGPYLLRAKMVCSFTLGYTPHCRSGLL